FNTKLSKNKPKKATARRPEDKKLLPVRANMPACLVNPTGLEPRLSGAAVDGAGYTQPPFCCQHGLSKKIHIIHHPPVKAQKCGSFPTHLRFQQGEERALSLLCRTRGAFALYNSRHEVRLA
ncbi:hypothetical protein, partial [Roseibium sp. RKSG952]|uniref:hypothetical protein n=1 Tax=Roseibium sp. RKSG952 TaxID=2529384 RepID=UPI001AD9031C